MAACATVFALGALGAGTAASGAPAAAAPPLVVATGAVPYIGALAVAGNARGQFVVAWVGASGIYARRGTVGGALGATQLLASGGGAEEPIFSAVATAIAPNGMAVVGWDRDIAGEGELQTAVAPAGSAFGAAQTLASKKAHNPLSGLHLAAVNGRLVALWFWLLPASKTRLYYAVAGGGRRFAPAVVLSSTPTRPPALAALASGAIVALWSARPGPVSPVQLTEAVLAPTASTFAPAQIITPVGTAGGNEFAPPSFTASSFGNAILAFGYTPRDAQTPPLVETAAIGATGQAGAPAVAGKVTVANSPTEWGFWGPAAARGARGSTLAAWVTTTYPTGEQQAASDLYVARSGAGGSFGATRLLLSTNDYITDPLAAAAGNGEALVWPQLTRSPAGADYNYGQERVMASVANAGAAPAVPTTLASTPLDDSGPLDVLVLGDAGSRALVGVIDAKTRVLSVYPLAP